MKILLTGATGFLGKHLLRELSAVDVHAISREWTDPEKISSIVATYKPTHCVHLAWDTLPGRYLDDKEGNLKLLQQSLELYQHLIANGCEQIITLGTCAEYAGSSEPMRIHNPLDPQTIYAAAKASLNLLGSQLCKNTDTKFCWARLFYVYGPGEHPARLMSGLLQKLMQNEEFGCGSGSKRKDYLYVLDAVAGIHALLKSKGSGSFNLCSGEGVTIKEIGAAAEAAVGTEGKVRYGVQPERPWDPDLLVGDNRELLALGWRPQYDLQQGLQHYVKTLREKA